MTIADPHALVINSSIISDIGGSISHSIDEIYMQALVKNLKENNADLLLRILTIVCGGGDRCTNGPGDIEKLLQLPKGKVFEVLKGIPLVFDCDGISLDKTFQEFIHDKDRARGFFVDAQKAPFLTAQMHLNPEPCISVVQPKTSIDLSPLVDRLSTLFKNKEDYRQLLACRDTSAQSLLDCFQMLLDTSRLDDSLRRHLVTAVQRLSDRSGLYPTCFNIDGVELVSETPVANGGFGDIFQGVFNNQSVCLKAIRLYQPSQVNYFIKRLSKEAIIWGQLTHPNLLPFYGIYRFRSRACLVSPWLEYGDITNYSKSHPNDNRTLLAKDISEGVLYLHTMDIIHGDLKGANILVTDNGRACLADFGISSVTDAQILNWTSHSSVGSKGGTVRWQAPELFDFDGDSSVHNTKASDIYSLSCVFYELFTGSVPFYNLFRDPAVMFRVQSGGQPTRPADSHIAWQSWGLTADIWSLMESCWNKIPDARPSIEEIASRLAQTIIEDNRPTEPDGSQFATRFHTSVGRYTNPFDIDKLEALIFGGGPVVLATA